MSIDKSINEHMSPDLVLRHERELSQLAIITEELKRQNVSIIEGIEELKSTLIDIRIIKDSVSTIEPLKERIIEINTTMRDINSNVVDLKEDLKEKEERIQALESSTSHLGWLNKSIKVTVDKAGTIFVAGLLALLATHWSALTKIIDMFKG